MATIRIADPIRPSRSFDHIDTAVGGVYPIRTLSLERTRSRSRDARSHTDHHHHPHEKLEDNNGSGDLRQAGDFKQKQVRADVFT